MSAYLICGQITIDPDQPGFKQLVDDRINKAINEARLVPSRPPAAASEATASADYVFANPSASDLFQEFRDLRGTLQEHGAEITQLKVHNADKDTQIEKQNLKIEEQGAEIDQLKIQNADKTGQFEKLIADNGQLHTELEACNNLVANLQEEKENLKVQVELQGAELEELGESHEQMGYTNEGKIPD